MYPDRYSLRVTDQCQKAVYDKVFLEIYHSLKAALLTEALE